MSFITFDQTEATKESTGTAGKKVLDSGVYNVVINTVSKTVARTGTIGVDINFTVEGAQYPNTVYGMWIMKPDGTKLFSYNILQSLMGLVGAKALTEYDKTVDVKDGTKIVTAFKELDNKPVKIAVQKILDWYNDDLSEKNEIKAFLDATTDQTFTEKLANKTAKQIEYYQKLQDKETDKYKKAMLDAEDEPTTAEEATGSLL
jgi:hypothetical protein